MGIHDAVWPLTGRLESRGRGVLLLLLLHRFSSKKILVALGLVECLVIHIILGVRLALRRLRQLEVPGSFGHRPGRLGRDHDQVISQVICDLVVPV